MNSNSVTDEQIIEACQISDSMSKACVKVGLHFNTFKRRALKLNCYVTNQGLKSSKKPWVKERAIDLQEILNNLHPQYQTFKLKNRLIKEGIKENKCEICGVSEWQGKEISCELDHIDGNSNNHLLSNLRILCPNCHSQTETYRSKRRR